MGGGPTLRLWFSPASEVPIYRQLATQVQLAILSGDLKPGERLPSTRELARRFSIHPNTVSAGYRQLLRDGWVEYRHGSGVYIQSEAAPAQTPEQILDQHIGSFCSDRSGCRCAGDSAYRSSQADDVARRSNDD